MGKIYNKIKEIHRIYKNVMRNTSEENKKELRDYLEECGLINIPGKVPNFRRAELFVVDLKKELPRLNEKALNTLKHTYNKYIWALQTGEIIYPFSDLPEVYASNGHRMPWPTVAAAIIDEYPNGVAGKSGKTNSKSGKTNSKKNKTNSKKNKTNSKKNKTNSKKNKTNSKKNKRSIKNNKDNRTKTKGKSGKTNSQTGKKSRRSIRNIRKYKRVYRKKSNRKNKKFNKNQRGSGLNDTPLEKAIDSNSIFKVLSELVKLDALFKLDKPNYFLNKNTSILLHKAAYAKNTFLSICNNDETRSGAAIIGMLLVAKADVNSLNKPEYTLTQVTPLYLASTNGYADRVAILLAYGAKKDIVPVEDKSLLHIVTKLKSESELKNKKQIEYNKIIKMLNTNSIEETENITSAPKDSLLEMLVKLKDLDSKIDMKNTLLHEKAEKGNNCFVGVLLAAGAEVDNKKTDEGPTPLWIASNKGHDIVAVLLLAAGAKVDNKKTADGTTPLWIASSMGHLEVVRQLIMHKAKFDEKNIINESPLWIASSMGHLEVVRQLLDKSNKGDNNKDDTTPLWIASSKGHSDIVRLLLFDNENNYNIRNEEGITPLWIASSKGHVDVVKLLLGYHPTPYIAANYKYKYQDKTPIAIATHPDIVQLFDEEIEAAKNLQKIRTDNE